MFWSGEELTSRLPALILPFNPSRVDCASYRLCLGEQAFATSDRFTDGQPDTPSIQVLASSRPDSTINIYPGQFAFLLTEESVEVPNDAIALISMRAGLKFKGLMNVSGFHVDPGWKGRLVFGVYNAGPKMLMLERGQDLFLIVFASLDRSSNMTYPGTNNNRSGIKLEWAEGMAGQVFSPMALQRQMQVIQSTQNDVVIKLADLKGRAGAWDTLLFTFLGLILAVILAIITTDFMKAGVGGWIKSAIDLHIETVQKEVAALPDTIAKEKNGQSNDKPASARQTSNLKPAPNGIK